MLRKDVLALIVSCAVAPAWAQTNDHLWRSADWSTVVVGPDGMALAGAVVALPDRSSAIAVNPALAASMQKTEVFGSGASRRTGSGIDGDAYNSKTSLLLLGGAALLPGGHLAVGGWIGQPRV